MSGVCQAPVTAGGPGQQGRRDKWDTGGVQEDFGAGAPRFRILGPLEMLDGGETVRVRSRLQRWLLTILLLEANRTVPADRLIEELWGDQPPNDPAGALRSQVSRLRRGLPTVAQMVTEPRGYRLTVDPDDVDIWRFEHLLTAAGRCSGDDALRLLDEALALWRIHPLDEFVERPPAQVEQRRLGELHGAARQHRASLLLAGGRAAEAAAEATALLADQPEREEARAVLMEALYRQGRATEALKVYQSWRRELGEEHGLEPSPALRDVEARILRHTIDAETDADTARRESIRVRRTQRPVSSFIGQRHRCGRCR